MLKTRRKKLEAVELVSDKKFSDFKQYAYPWHSYSEIVSTKFGVPVDARKTPECPVEAKSE
jgi:hypothetical protein